ncbi:MAG TPA: hypothetical protein PLH72_07340 [Vicinamibacterales bacterium]|nr:hypothetical protein [Vicinamibacterales bacterium]
MPTITLPFTASGAMVIEWPVPLSATWVSHRTAPVPASSATSAPSSEPTNTLSSRMATPRLVAGNPISRRSDGMGRT